jgi:predicted ATPase
MLDQRDENTRYQVLETIRDYAHEKLEHRTADWRPPRRSTATTISRWPRRPGKA